MKQQVKQFLIPFLIIFGILFVSSLLFVNTKQRVIGEVTVKSFEVSVLAGEDSYSVFVPVGSTVFEAMSTASMTKGLSFRASDYPGLGFFVEEINGIKNGQGKYWTLYVNGVYSNVGASSYELESGDRIEWRYEKR
jgi:hypothetical protein